MRKVLRAYKSIGESAYFRIIVTPNGKPIEGIGRVPTYVYMSQARYEQVFSPALKQLEIGEGWRITRVDLSSDEVDTTDSADDEPEFVLSKDYLESRQAERNNKFPKIVSIEETIPLTFMIPEREKCEGKTAQIYITPITEKLGFECDEGDLYEAEVVDGRATLPVTAAELHREGWQYQVDIVVPLEGAKIDTRFKLIVLDKGAIGYISAVYFNEKSNVSADSPLLRKLHQLPVCENGKNCPLLAVYKENANTPAFNDIPPYVVEVSEWYVPNTVFENVEGISWHDTVDEERVKAFSHFTQKMVTIETNGRSRNSSVIVSPPAADDSQQLEPTSPTLSSGQNSNVVDESNDDLLGSAPVTVTPSLQLRGIAREDDASNHSGGSVAEEKGKGRYFEHPDTPTLDDVPDGNSLSRLERPHTKDDEGEPELEQAKDNASDVSDDELTFDKPSQPGKFGGPARDSKEMIASDDESS